MYLLFGMMCLLLLAFNLEWVAGKPWHDHYVMIWQWGDFRLIRILPKDAFVLIEGDTAYRYYANSSMQRDTYVRAIQMDNGMERDVLHYRYLLDWIKTLPVLRSYPSELQDDEIAILNDVSKKLK